MNIKRWWWISSGTSILFIALIGLMWFRIDSSYQPNLEQLANEADIIPHLKRRGISLNKSEAIPTGVFLQSLKFNNATEVNVTGYIWQIYDKSIFAKVPKDQDVPVGFILPEAVDSGNNLDPQQAYRRSISDTEEVIGWYFESTLKQRFNYKKYPLDHKTVWIRIWGKDFARSNMLVPDLNAYKSTQAGDTFGLDDSIVLGEWEVEETFFDFKTPQYDMDFGLETPLPQTPELYFNVVLKREFLGAFIVNLVPLLISAILLFATLLTITVKEGQADIFGFSTSEVLGVCSALFFVVLLSHIQIRQEIPGSDIIYIEYFYLAMYVALLGVAVDSYLFTHDSYSSQFKFISYEDNIFPKLIFWPTLLGTSAFYSFLILKPFQPYKSNFLQPQTTHILLPSDRPLVQREIFNTPPLEFAHTVRKSLPVTTLVNPPNGQSYHQFSSTSRTEQSHLTFLAQSSSLQVTDLGASRHRIPGGARPSGWRSRSYS
ncbi:hypothetical protein [Acaryochloris marina]|uniref:Uncharacterized protein n=1 Tax=Acaryochloris marina (strain MBIC 11017) TaxID=329726 RepID=A8ZM29_ACAM1|nr:hypothetical protein [Acaryochloris marina]ABW31798.1 conserved hypothetical protein [Acaryochloris marina MBIC11017]